MSTYSNIELSAVANFIYEICINLKFLMKLQCTAGWKIILGLSFSNWSVCTVIPHRVFERKTCEGRRIDRRNKEEKKKHEKQFCTIS